MYQNPDQELEAALKDCASEAVQTPGAVQSHGALIAVSRDDLEIRYASDNSGAFLRVSADKLLGKSIRDVFGRKARHELANGVMLLDATGKASDLGVIDFGGTPLSVTASSARSHIMFEFETAPDNMVKVSNALKDLEFLMAQAGAATSAEDLFDTSVRLLQMLTGYDRVSVLAFDEEGHGDIVSEAVRAGVDSFLGLRFPSWDIPAQARELMTRLPLRYIADSSAQPVAVLAASQHPEELDMTYAHLRAVSPVHLNYLRNMGVAACLSLYIVVEERVWGMISFHHETPRCPSQRIRQMCRSYADFFALKLSNFLKASDLERLQKPDVLRRKLSKKSDELGLEKIFEAELLKELATAMASDGAALIYENTISTVGTSPGQKALQTITETGKFPQGVTASANIKLDFPQLAGPVGPDIAGLLVAQLRKNCTFMFFRKARDRVIRWAGAPEKPVYVHGGRARLGPRASFAEYLEHVKGTSEPWTPDQLRIAEELWTMLVTSERADLIRKTNRQQSLLIDELNHRVRNILALMRSLSQQSRGSNGSIESYVTALEARISALAAAHDLGADKTAPGATLAQIIEHEAAPYNQESERVKISGSDSGILSDNAPMFALVVHELMTNAAKYGALSVDAGSIDITLVKTDAGVELRWRELNGPTVTEPDIRGFGTEIIDASVPTELRGAVRCEFLPSGLRVDISLPSDILLEKMSIETQETHKPSAPVPKPPPEDLAITSQTCLVLEDNFVVSLDTTRVLQNIGFEQVDTTFTVKDALDRIERDAPGVAILDINLSHGQTSEPVARALKARGIPFIFVSGYGDTMKLDETFRASPVLKKPVREDELRRMLLEIGT